MNFLLHIETARDDTYQPDAVFYPVCSHAPLEWARASDFYKAIFAQQEVDVRHGKFRPLKMSDRAAGRFERHAECNQPSILFGNGNACLLEEIGQRLRDLRV